MLTKFFAKIPSQRNLSIVVVFNKVPNEPNNCLYVVWNKLNTAQQSIISKVISEASTSAVVNLGEQLSKIVAGERSFLDDIHRSGLLEKINTELVILEPLQNQTITQAELNRQLDNIAKESAMVQLSQTQERLADQGIDYSTLQQPTSSVTHNAFSMIEDYFKQPVVTSRPVEVTPTVVDARLTAIETALAAIMAKLDTGNATAAPRSSDDAVSFQG